MQRWIIKVVVTDKSAPYFGDNECYLCGERVWHRIPYNYPQVCRECADLEVWQYGKTRKE